MVPVYQEKRGHPVTISTRYLGEIDQLTGPGGLRNLIDQYRETVYFYRLQEAGITIDLDDYQQYQQLRREYQRD